MKILLVDDQRSARLILTRMLQQLPDVEFVEAGSLAEARLALEAHAPDIALVDIRLEADSRNRDGMTFLREAAGRTRTVVVTSFTEVDDILEAMRAGASDYIFKDKLCEELVVPIVSGLRSRHLLEREVLQLRARQGRDGFPTGLVGTSPPMQRLREGIGRVALSDRPVLVTGPTGSGKELVVAAIHALGAHPEAPLLDLNCGAIPEALIESQLFGHEKGAFTGADRKQEGYFTAVRQGTLFLDEIAELDLGLQAKLLRVLETGRFRAVGSMVELRLHGRVVAATHADLGERVRSKRFREDLYFRLNVLEVRVPALAERREDIPALAVHFAQGQRRALRFSDDALEHLQAREWPGNVRQLRNLIDRIAVFAPDDRVTADAIRSLDTPANPSVPAAPASSMESLARQILQLPDASKLDAIESALVESAMTLAQGNKTGAARLLGCHRKVVERRLEARMSGGTSTWNSESE